MSKTINISYFLNPYCFYFKFDDDLHDSSLQSLEDKISKYACDEIKQNNNEKPSIAVGDVVVAYLIPWSKWVRAVVRCDFDRLKCYELWAIDHGKVFRAAYKNVVKLPESLAKEEFAGIRRGSFYGVAPAKLVSIDKIMWKTNDTLKCSCYINLNSIKIFEYRLFSD